MRPSPLVSSLLAALCFGAAGVVALADDAGVSSPSVVDQVGAPVPAPTLTSVPTPAETTAPEPALTMAPLPDDHVQLAVDLRALLEDPQFATGSLVTAVVLDELGRVVVEQHPTAGAMPASTMKLLVAAASLERHGPAARLATPVLIRGTVSARGTLVGDVIVVGAGDPSLASGEYQRFVYPARPAGDTAQVVEVLRAAGIERITGDVIADPGPFADDPTPEGWRDGYFQDFNARQITGLTVDAGLVVHVDAPKAAWPDLTAEQIADGAVRITMASDPVLHAAEVLREELRRGRLPIEGVARVGQADVDDVPIGALQSPPLQELLAFMLKHSDNHLADTLLRELGTQAPGGSTWQSSMLGARELLSSLGLDVEDAVIHDGSGLSRDDLLSARLLAQLDQRMTASANGPLWTSLQSVAGKDGTLRRRLAGTLADGRFRGKTGTLTDVRALVGAVEGPDGRRYHLALLANGGEVWRAQDLADQMVLRLTRSLLCGAGSGADVPASCAA